MPGREGFTSTTADVMSVAAHGLISSIKAAHPLPRYLRGAVIALGNFDGFHLGHQAVVRRAVAMARARGVAAIVGTFDPHPVDYFKPDASPFRLTTLDQRRRLLAPAGVDAMMVFQFNGALASVTPEAFVEKWLAEVGGVVTGENFTFGQGRAGDVRRLAELGAKRGLACAVVEPVLLDGEVVSSTRIREALQAGDCAAAARLLSRPFTIEGVLQPRNKSGQWRRVAQAAIGQGEYLQPANGLYSVRVQQANGRIQKSIARFSNSSSLEQKSLKLFLPTSKKETFAEQIQVAFISRIADNVTKIPYL